MSVTQNNNKYVDTGGKEGGNFTWLKTSVSLDNKRHRNVLGVVS